MSYIGPERRKGVNRRRQHKPRYNPANERRIADRRQEAQAGVVMGFSDADLLHLRALWEARDRLDLPAAHGVAERSAHRVDPRYTCRCGQSGDRQWMAQHLRSTGAPLEQL